MTRLQVLELQELVEQKSRIAIARRVISETLATTMPDEMRNRLHSTEDDLSAVNMLIQLKIDNFHKEL